MAVAETIGPGLVREQSDDTVLRLAFGAGLFSEWTHSATSQRPPLAGPTRRM
ncbi:hypothetical protein COMA2_30074 [Candidatus Nitrospira nitrificans]|uniref:Biopterin-dependent aromatic amino acid hydroxylase family profile domain-containing protein n=1 Tax=Candidatus Nitrospira nitrificans TaxID=1742973 RepID=A0A0S4LKQ0_9BACT|nr:hypothetical protein COMA2_30074 [Candidatus Nitrospira nitrificans]